MALRSVKEQNGGSASWNPSSTTLNNTTYRWVGCFKATEIRTSIFRFTLDTADIDCLVKLSAVSWSPAVAFARAKYHYILRFFIKNVFLDFYSQHFLRCRQPTFSKLYQIAWHQPTIEILMCRLTNSAPGINLEKTPNWGNFCVEAQPKRSYSATKTRCSEGRQTSPQLPPPVELDETYASSLTLAYYIHYTNSQYFAFLRGRSMHDVIHKTGST